MSFNRVKPLGAGQQYESSEFLLARRVFRSGDFMAVVDLDGIPSTRMEWEIERDPCSANPRHMIPRVVLRYVGESDQVASIILRESSPGFRCEYDRFYQEPGLGHQKRTRQALDEASPLRDLLAVIDPIRVEEVAVPVIQMSPSVFGEDNLGRHAFAGGDQLMVRLGDDLDLRCFRWGFLQEVASGNANACRPDFMPVNRSQDGMLSLFAKVEIDDKARNIRVVRFLIEEAVQRFAAASSTASTSA